MTTDWRRYYFEDDEIKVEHIDSRVVYYENPDERMWVDTKNNDVRFRVIRAGIHDWRPGEEKFYQWKPNEGWTPAGHFNPYPGDMPHLRNTPWAPIRKSPVALAVKIALDGSVN